MSAKVVIPSYSWVVITAACAARTGLRCTVSATTLATWRTRPGAAAAVAAVPDLLANVARLRGRCAGTAADKHAVVIVFVTWFVRRSLACALPEHVRPARAGGAAGAVG